MENWDYPFTPDQLKLWKSISTNINALQIGTEYYVFKPLTVSELRELQIEELKLVQDLNMDQKLAEEEKLLIVQNRYIEATAIKCVLWPLDFKDKVKSLPCGVLERLNAEIFRISGYDETIAEPIKL